MSKKIIIVLALAFVLGISVAAFAEVQNVKVGGDFTVVGASRDGLNFVNDNNAGRVDAAAWASVARVKIDANLTDNVDVSFRLINERVLGTTEAAGDNTAAVDVDIAFVALKEFMKDTINTPVTLVIGRQNIKIGSGLLIGAPGGNQGNIQTALPAGLTDLSARAAFDAIVGVADFSPFTLTAGVVKVTEGAITSNKDDVNVVVVHGAYNFGEDAKNTVLEGTYAFQRATNKTSISNIGGRVTLKPVKDLGVEAEYVLQTARKDMNGAFLKDAGKERDSDALRLAASLGLPDTTWTPTLGLDYTRLSKYWNPFHESMSPASIANILFANTDISCIGASVSAKPKEDLALTLRYANLQLAKKWEAATYTCVPIGIVYATNVGKKDVGYEIDAGLAYDYTEDVQIGLNWGMFKPGNMFTSANRKAASQVIGSMKVTF